MASWPGWVTRTASRVSPAPRPSAPPRHIVNIGPAARYFVWEFATIIGLSWLGFDLTSLAILGGAIGVGLGIGLQGFFGNLFAGVVILFERSVKVGDFVTCSPA